MSFKSLAVLLGLTAMLWTSIPDVQASCPSGLTGLTLSNFAISPSSTISIRGGTYTVSGTISISGGAAGVSHLDATLSGSATVQAGIISHTINICSYINCAIRLNCEALKNYFALSGVTCDSSFQLQSGQYSFSTSVTVPDMTSSYPILRAFSISGSGHGQVIAANPSGTNVGCVRETFSVGS